MLFTICNWCYVFLLSYVFGLAISKMIYKLSGYRISRWETIIIMGIMSLTVYAQLFSLIAPVGRWANVLLIFLGLGLVIVCRMELTGCIAEMHNKKLDRNRVLQAVGIVFIILLFAALSCQRAIHADTDGYHAQAIRWIEEYGVVKGLGNLYHRLAYNSAFMSLQALFSWRFLIDQSMHVMNGFLCCVMFFYALDGIWKKRNKLSGGDLFRVLLMIYIILPQSISVMSSPNTDTFALLLVVFVLGKWYDLMEEREVSPIPYAVLSLVAVFAVSVKLSTVFLTVLALKPAYQMIKERSWRIVAFFICMGIIVLFPFLFRNILISGYLVYPYNSIDLFSVDWKMLPSVVECDRKEILVWGRALYDINKSEYGVCQWFPIWWRVQELWVQIMMVLNGILLIPGSALLMKDIKEKRVDDVLFSIETTILFVGWILSAPLQRYGVVFLFVFPIYVISRLVMRIHWESFLFKIIAAVTLLCMAFLLFAVIKMEPISMKRSAYYVYRECEEVDWNGISVYLPVENGYMGYYYLPATQHRNMLNYIELIGEEVEEGFRVKREYIGERIDTSGGKQ